jgi:uncharacterized protein (TIGR03435 family)
MDMKTLALALVVGGMVAVAAQSSKPAFEVASVKRSVSKSFSFEPPVRPGGAFVAPNDTLEGLIRFAYDLPAYRIVGGPDWMRTDRFDVEARAGRDASLDELRQMVQTMLQDRFQLVVRTEQREMPVHALVLARVDNRVGPNMRQSAADCAKPDGRGETVEERRTPNGGVATRRTCAPMESLVSSLENALQGPVVDKTTLVGRWDYELSFTGERRRGADPSAAARDPNDAPALFTAVQEQLGLRVEPGRGPVEILIVESAAPPTGN